MWRDGMSVIDLMAQGIHRALDDCGLKLGDVDGAVLGHDAEPPVGGGARRVPGPRPRRTPAPPSSAARRSSTTWRTPWRRSRRACATLRSSPTAARSAASAASRPPARDQPLRVPVQAVHAVVGLRAGGLAPHAPVRHHARADGGGGGCRARMGAAQPGGVGEEAAHHRGRAVRAHGELSLHGARLLPRHRRRRRHHRHLGRAGASRSRRSRPTCWAAASRRRTPPSPTCRT